MSADLTPELERDLAQRYRAGDKAAGAQLVEALLPQIRRQAARCTRNRQLQRDLVQEGVIGAYEALRTFEPAKGRLHSLAWRHIRGRQTALAIRGKAPFEPEVEVATEATQEEEAERARQFDRLRTTMPRLPRLHKRVLFERYLYRSETYCSDISADIGVTPSYIARIEREALKLLRVALGAS